MMRPRHTNAAISANPKADGLRAVSEPLALPDLCHHAHYNVYVDGQYVESAGSLGANAARVVEFYRRKRCGKVVEARAGRCNVPGCTWKQSGVSGSTDSTLPDVLSIKPAQSAHKIAIEIIDDSSTDSRVHLNEFSWTPRTERGRKADV